MRISSDKGQHIQQQMEHQAKCALFQKNAHSNYEANTVHKNHSMGYKFQGNPKGNCQQL